MPLEDFLKKYPDERFDLVCFYHVLEHLENPAEFLANIKKILNPGGYIAFSFPNPHRLDLTLLKREKWDYPPHHLTRWNEKSTEYLLNKTGYTKIFSEQEPLSILRTTESIGTFIEGWFSSAKPAHSPQDTDGDKKTGTAPEKLKEKKLYYAIKKSIKPMLMAALFPAGIILYMIGKKKNLTGQAMLVIAKISE